MADYEKIIVFFNDYLNHYKGLLAFEQEKLNFLISNDIKKLNDSLSNEQAFIMKGEALEKKRISMLKGEGISELHFKEMIDNAPKNYQDRLICVYTALQNYIMEVKRINELSMEKVSDRLKRINEKTNTKTSGTYNEHGGKNNKFDYRSMLSKNV